MWSNTCQLTCWLLDCLLCSSLTCISNSLVVVVVIVVVTNTRHRHMVRGSELRHRRLELSSDDYEVSSAQLSSKSP